MTIFINPTSATNGAGTLIDPKNTPVGIDWAADDDFAIVAGAPLVRAANSVINPTVSGTVSARKTLRSYEPGTGDPTTDKAIIRGGSTACQFGIQLASNVGFWTIQDIDVAEFGTTSSVSHGISAAVSPANDAQEMKIVVQRCAVHDGRNGSADCNGINLRGRGNLVQDCLIWNVPTDGIFFNGWDTVLQYNTIWDINQDGRNQGDCIQKANNAGGSIIRYNYCDASAGTGKQVLMLGDTTGAGDRRIVVHSNTLIGAVGAQQGIYTDVPIWVFDNTIIDCITGIRALGLAVITGNRFYNYRSPGTHYGVWAEGNGVTVMNNMFMNYMPWEPIQYAIRCGDGHASNVIQNNLIFGYRAGIRLDEGAGQTESYNWIHGTEVPVLGISANPSLGTGSSTNDWRPYVNINGEHIIPDYATLADVASHSPLAKAGNYRPGVRLANALMKPGLVPIGPYEAVIARQPRVAA